jgi:hypothetical protein
MGSANFKLPPDQASPTFAHISEIRVESLCDADPKKAYPVCTGGSGACPPEECGGSKGYLERRDEADGYGAWQDFGVMVEWLDDLTKQDTTDLTVRDVLTGVGKTWWSSGHL